VTGTDSQCGQSSQEESTVRGFLQSLELSIWKRKETLKPHLIKAASSSIIEEKRECDKTDISAGVVEDRWTARHAACACASLCAWRSLGVRPRSVGVRTDPGQTGAGGSAVPVSVPV